MMKKNRTDDVKGYKIDFANNTLTLNCKFADAAMNDYGSAEYERMKSILEDFPGLTIVVKKGRDIKTTRPTKRLTYANMETYISTFDNAAELQMAFETVKTLSKPLASPYAYVRDWFAAQFPNYRTYISDLQRQQEASDTENQGDSESQGQQNWGEGFSVKPIPFLALTAYKKKGMEEYEDMDKAG